MYPKKEIPGRTPVTQHLFEAAKYLVGIEMDTRHIMSALNISYLTLRRIKSSPDWKTFEKNKDERTAQLREITKRKEMEEEKNFQPMKGGLYTQVGEIRVNVTLLHDKFDKLLDRMRKDRIEIDRMMQTSLDNIRDRLRFITSYISKNGNGTATALEPPSQHQERTDANKPA